MDINIKDYVTIKEAAVIMNRKRSWVSQLCLDGRMPGAFKVADAAWLIPRIEAENFKPAPVGRPPGNK